MKYTFLVLLCVSLAWKPASAEEQKEAPKLLHVQGSAVTRVPMDSLRLVFTYPVEKSSFVDAATVAKTIQHNMRPRLNDSGKIEIKVINGWDMLKQSKMSVGDRGRKVDIWIAFELENIPLGTLFETLGTAVDSALQADDKIRLESAEAYIPPAKERQVRLALYKDAAMDAHQQAQQLTEGAKAQLGTLRFIVPGESSLPSNMAIPQDPLDMRSYSTEIQKTKFRSTFKVSSEVQDEAELEQTVRAVYDLK